MHATWRGGGGGGWWVEERWSWASSSFRYLFLGIMSIVSVLSRKALRTSSRLDVEMLSLKTTAYTVNVD